MHQRPNKPQLRVQPTTLWEYPSQHYGPGQQGDQKYVGATPSYVIWNMIERYTKPGDLVVDPFCGSGTTLDVAKDTGRKGRGFDLSPYRADIERADARKLPLETGSVDLVFMDPPQHRTYRRMVSSRFTPRAMTLLETHFDEWAHHHETIVIVVSLGVIALSLTASILASMLIKPKVVPASVDTPAKVVEP